MYAAVDIGGTKTLVAVFDRSGKLIEQQKFPTPQNYEQFVSELAVAVDKLSTKDFQRSVAAVPGKIDRKHGVGIAFGNLPWEMVPVQADTEKILLCPVIIENDAKLAALYEAMHVKDKYNKVLYITISTGIGGGLIINGEIDPLFRDIEVGHMLLEHGDKLQRWEEFASGKAFQAKFGKRVGDTAPDETEAWYWLSRNLAVGLIDVVASLNPEVIILGGGVGSHYEKFKDRLNDELKIYENPLVTIPPILGAVHAEEAVIYGCYELARKHHARVSKKS